MKFARCLLFVMLVCFPTFSLVHAEVGIEIHEPKDKETVMWRSLVTGSVSDKDAKVYLVIHPNETSEYWVQPNATMKENGEWTVNAYFGRRGSIDSTKSFEIRAVVNPKHSLKEGLRLNSWPNAAAKSEVLNVVRN